MKFLLHGNKYQSNQYAFNNKSHLVLINSLWSTFIFLVKINFKPSVLLPEGRLTNSLVWFCMKESISFLMTSFNRYLATASLYVKGVVLEHICYKIIIKWLFYTCLLCLGFFLSFLELVILFLSYFLNILKNWRP